ncbi:MAG: insulinase family protein [Candidatus Cloacimonetes bacterium]|nr:insulinase family protein [Candidatus Cloacimonadota bacterium]
MDKISSFITENGLKVIYAIDNSNPLVCIQLYVRIGSAWESREESGFAHFTEHLVFKSTLNFPANSVMDTVTNLGGHINAYTEYDSTCYYITLPADFFQQGLAVLADLVQNANYDEEDFRAEKSVILEEHKQFQNDPEDFFIEEIPRHYFKHNPYRNPIIGDIRNITGATRSDLQEFYRKYYIPDNCFLVVCGAITMDQIRKAVPEQFAGWKNRSLSRRQLRKEAFPSEPRLISFSRKISNDMLAFGLPDVADSHPDSYALSLICKAFAIGKNSRLYTRLFNLEQLVDSIKVHSLSGINNGMNIILVMPKKKADLQRIISVFLEELQLLIEFGLNEIEIEEFKKEMIYFYKYTFEYVESLASSLGSEELLTTYENFLKYPARLNRLTRPVINKVISRYFKPESLYIFHIGRQLLADERSLKKEINSVRTRTHSETNDYFNTNLDNGLKLVFKKVKGKPTIGISLTSEVSQLQERINNRGLNLLTSGLMLYGNSKRNYQQFINFCSQNGISFGISPRSETTSFNMKCFSELLDTSLELMAEVVLQPIFPRDYLENLKRTYISNFDRIRDYPQYYAVQLWKEMIFGKQSNLISSEGTKQSVRGLTRKQITQWYDNYYALQDMTLTLVGDFDFFQMEKTCNRFFSQAARPVSRLPQEVYYQSSPSHKKNVNKKMNQSVINLGGFACSTSQVQKNTAFHVLAQLVGGDMNSILFDELREKRGLAYSVEFDFRAVRNLGYFLISAIVDKNNEEETIAHIIRILEDIKDNGISSADLEMTKNYIRGQRLLEEESLLNRAETLSILEVLGFGYQYYLDRDQRLNDVSMDQIHDLAREYFNPGNFFIHVLS